MRASFDVCLGRTKSFGGLEVLEGSGFVVVDVAVAVAVAVGSGEGDDDLGTGCERVLRAILASLYAVVVLEGLIATACCVCVFVLCMFVL